MKRFSIYTLTGLFLLSLLPFHAIAANPADVVINEVAWAGSQDSSTEEWIELYNNTSSSIDLAGWKIIDDDTTEYLLNGIIPANGYFLLEDSESVTSIPANQVLPISLANTGDKLVLVDDTSQTIDTVNSTGSAWFAGNSTNAHTMEKISPELSGDDVANWASNTSSSGETSSSGSVINGTPATLNSVTTVPTTVNLSLPNTEANPSDTVTLTMSAANVSNLYSYGFQLDYDPAVINFSSATKGDLLSESNLVSTSFQSALENSQEGKLLIAEARLNTPANGIDGTGTLFTADFNVIGAAGSNTTITISPTSFLADPNQDIIASFSDATVSVALDIVDPITNATIAEDAARYSLRLDWNAPASGADSYNIYRKDQSGNFVLLNNQINLFEIDSQNLIPTHTYEYQIVVAKAGQESVAVNISGQETRGLIGDNDRSDRVDGRDLQNLAAHFAQDIIDPNFDPLVDTTYDALIDGADLLDLTANFGLTYQ